MALVYTPEQVSDMLSGIVAPRTLRNWASERRIPSIKGGSRTGKIGFTQEHVQQIIASMSRPRRRQLERAA